MVKEMTKRDWYRKYYIKNMEELRLKSKRRYWNNQLNIIERKKRNENENEIEYKFNKGKYIIEFK